MGTLERCCSWGCFSVGRDVFGSSAWQLPQKHPLQSVSTCVLLAELLLLPSVTHKLQRSQEYNSISGSTVPTSTGVSISCFSKAGGLLDVVREGQGDGANQQDLKEMVMRREIILAVGNGLLGSLPGGVVEAETGKGYTGRGFREG